MSAIKKAVREKVKKALSQYGVMVTRDGNTCFILNIKDEEIDILIDKATLAQKKKDAEVAREMDKEIPMTYNSYEVARTEGWNGACEAIFRAILEQDDE